MVSAFGFVCLFVLGEVVGVYMSVFVFVLIISQILVSAITYHNKMLAFTYLYENYLSRIK